MYVTVPTNRTLGAIFEDNTIPSVEMYGMVFQKIFTPSRIQLGFDALVFALAAYMNLWNETAWFAAGMIPNTAFEIYYLIDGRYNMPDLFFKL